MRASVTLMLAVVAAIGTCGRARAATTEVPFQRGVNLTSWLQAGGARQIQFTQFTKQDLAHGTRHEDCVGRWANFAHWDPDVAMKAVRGADIPLRMLVPRKADNLLVAGRFCSVLRSMTSCMVMGQGAGIAAAMAADRGVRAASLPADDVKSAAVEQGVNVGTA